MSKADRIYDEFEPEIFQVMEETSPERKRCRFVDLECKMYEQAPREGLNVNFSWGYSAEVIATDEGSVVLEKGA